MTNDVIMTSLPKTMTKIRTSATPDKLYIIRKDNKSYSKMCCLLNLSRCVKSYGHFCQILAFYDAHSLNMVMSRGPRCSFQKFFYFVLILYLIFEKVTKFLVEKLSTSEVISQKPHWKHPPPPPPLFPSAFRLKDLSVSVLCKGLVQVLFRTCLQ